MNSDVVIRLAHSGDEVEVRRVADRDSAARAPAGMVLVAEVGGAIRAAMSATTGEVVADPFAPTAAIVDLLRLRTAQLRAEGSKVGRETAAYRPLLHQHSRARALGGSG